MRCPAHIALYLSMLVCSAWTAVSCSGDNPAYPRENLKGTWLVHTWDGTLLDERSWNVLTFSSSGSVTWAGVITMEDANYQWGDNTLYYDVYCCDLSVCEDLEIKT